MGTREGRPGEGEGRPYSCFSWARRRPPLTYSPFCRIGNDTCRYRLLVREPRLPAACFSVPLSRLIDSPMCDEGRPARTTVSVVCRPTAAP